MTGFDLVRELPQLDLQPGDVIITGNRDPVSVAIQRATGSKVSHVMMSVGDGMIVECNEYRNLADDRHGGVYLRALMDAIDETHVDRVVIRRPLGVRHDEVIASAQRFLQVQPVFSMSGIVFAGVLVAFGQFWTEHVADLVLGADRSDAIERHFAELVADGTERMVCAELVYRVLHDAHVPLAHGSLFLEDAIRFVPPLAPPRSMEAAAPVDLTFRERLAQAVEEADRDPEDNDAVSAIDRLGWPVFIRLVGRQVRRAYEIRRTEIDDGDLADLITPRDFLEMQPFAALLDVEHSRGKWESTA